MNFTELNSIIPALDKDAEESAQKRWNDIAKPLGSLGQLEKTIVQLAGLTGNTEPNINRRAVLVLCADNGVAAQGVTQINSGITALMTAHVAAGDSCVAVMAKQAKADVIPVDIGVLSSVDARGVINRKIAYGTNDITRGPAMSREQAIRAVQTGIDLVRECKADGYNLLATGEMGIGNTTTSSAIAATLLKRDVEEVTGRGAGLSDEGLKRKVAAIMRAIDVNAPRRDDALDVLHKLGGFDIAGMCGIFIGGALYRVPVLLDGVISAISALIAARLCPASRRCMIASHLSAEPAGRIALKSLGLQPLITAQMRLGEGTGAVCAMPLLDMALAVYYNAAAFSDIGINPYGEID